MARASSVNNGVIARPLTTLRHVEIDGITVLQEAQEMPMFATSPAHAASLNAWLYSITERCAAHTVRDNILATAHRRRLRYHRMTTLRTTPHTTVKEICPGPTRDTPPPYRHFWASDGH